MQHYNYDDVKNVVVCGDIHGDFHTLVYKLCVQYGLTDTLLVVAGDCGFGFEMPAYYTQVYNREAGRLKKANNYVAFVRGNHDNPAYFNEERISYKRWRTIPDYAVISACGHNILCIGGAISIDREYRKRQLAWRATSQTGYYWSDEAPVFSAAAIDDITVPVDTIVTHTAPSLCEKHDKKGLRYWAESDPTLLDDVAAERYTLDMVHDYLLQKGHPLREWYYGHFHQSWAAAIEGIRYRMLDIMEFYDLTPHNSSF